MPTPQQSAPTVGRSILALVCLLVALLAITLVYGLMAHGCRSGLRWLKWYAPLALILLTVVALADLARNEVLDLASALVFLLAVAANMAVIGYTRSIP